MLASAETSVPSLRPLALPPLPAEPLVSVIISSYNYERYLGTAIESVLAQTYQTFELIVCDDGSKDASPEIAATWAARDGRIRAIVQANAGQAAAWNRGFRESSGEIVCFLDSDDAFAPDKLRAVVDTAHERPRAGIIIHQLVPISATGAAIAPPRPFEPADGWQGERVLAQGGWGAWSESSSISLRRAVADRVFPIPSRFRTYTDLYVNSTAQFLSEFAGMRRPLGYRRLHGTNAGGAVGHTLTSLRGVVEYNTLTTEHMRQFLREQFGPQVAARLQVDRIHDWYWEQLLALYIAESHPPAVAGYDRDELLARLSSPRRRATWQLMTACPPSFGARLLDLYWISRNWWLGARYALSYGSRRSRR